MSTEKQTLYFLDNPAFSKQYLDYEIPDYREIINRTATIIIDESGSVEVNYAGETRLLSGEELFAFLAESQSDNRKFVCYDAVNIHKKLLEAATLANFQSLVWNLSACFSLWDIGLLDQRIVWAVEGWAVPFPEVTALIGKYSVPASNQHQCLRELLRRQFCFLIGNLPYLKNDIVGRRIFREHELDSPYLNPPDRVAGRRNVHYKERLWSFLGLIEGWKKYGPAAVGIDVQGAIVGEHLSKTQVPIVPDPVCFADRQANVAQKIKRNQRLASCYPESKPATDPNTGWPQYSEKAGEKITELWWSESAPENETAGARQYRLYPLDPNSLSTASVAAYRTPFVWGENIPLSGPLRLWSDYHVASLAWHHVACMPQEPLKYESQPFLENSIVNYTEQNAGTPFLRAEVGKKFLVLKIENLNLFCYSWCTESMDHGTVHDPDNFPIEYPVPEGTEANVDAVRYELAPYLAQILRVVHRAYDWNNLDTLIRLKAFHEDGIWRAFSTVIISGILSPEILSENPDKLLMYERLARIECDFTEKLKEDDFESLEASIEQHVLNMPCWLSRNDTYQALACLVLDCFICGHSKESTIRSCQERFGHDAEVAIIVDNMISWLASRTSYRDHDSLHYPWQFLLKAGIDPCVTSANLNNLTVVADGEEMQIGRPEHDNEDPLLRRSRFQATICRALWEGNNERNRNTWDRYILPLFGELFKELEISTDEGSKDVYDFFYRTSSMSLTGRPGRPVTEIEKHFESWQVFRDDILKTAGHALLRDGLPLLAVTKDSFVLQISNSEDEHEIQTRCEEIISSTISDFLSLDYIAGKTPINIKASVPPVCCTVQNVWPEG